MLENNNLQIEIETLQQSLGEAKKKESEMEIAYRKQHETTIAEHEKAIEALRAEYNEEKDKETDYYAKYMEAKEEIKKLQEACLEYNKQKFQEALNAQAEDFKLEKQKLLRKMKEIEEIGELRLVEKDAILKANEVQFNEDSNTIERKYRTAINEKKAIEAQFKNLLESSKFTEETLNSECSGLKKGLNVFLTDGGMKEENLRVFVTNLSKELLNMQEAFSQRELDLVEDVKRVEEERKSIQMLTENIHRDVGRVIVSPDYASVFEAQKKELELTLQAFENKSKEIEAMEKELPKFNSSRKALTAAAESFS